LLTGFASLLQEVWNLSLSSLHEERGKKAARAISLRSGAPLRRQEDGAGGNTNINLPPNKNLDYPK
jgi:hypothetical protein